MELKAFFKEALALSSYSLYPFYILYTNFIFLGQFTLDPKFLGKWAVLFLFVFFNILQTFTIIYYILIYTSESKSTQDIFPMTSNIKIDRNFTNINPFIAERLKERSIEKTHSCDICQTYKPPRCHHCSRCSKCFLKMDHHCLFLDTCIGFHNYKFFIQFLIINIVMIIFNLTIVSLDTSINTNNKNEVLVNYIIFAALSVIALCIFIPTAIYHFALISNNETTIERLTIDEYLVGNTTFVNNFQEGPISQGSNSKDRKVLNPYNLGVKENWIQVFGTSPKDWILPSFSSVGDGITFKKNEVNEDERAYRI